MVFLFSSVTFDIINHGNFLDHLRVKEGTPSCSNSPSVWSVLVNGNVGKEGKFEYYCNHLWGATRVDTFFPFT